MYFYYSPHVQAFASVALLFVQSTSSYAHSHVPPEDGCQVDDFIPSVLPSPALYHLQSCVEAKPLGAGLLSPFLRKPSLFAAPSP